MKPTIPQMTLDASSAWLSYIGVYADAERSSWLVLFMAICDRSFAPPI